MLSFLLSASRFLGPPTFPLIYIFVTNFEIMTSLWVGMRVDMGECVYVSYSEVSG